jgi:hypothetical protein
MNSATLSLRSLPRPRHDPHHALATILTTPSPRSSPYPFYVPTLVYAECVLPPELAKDPAEDDRDGHPAKH